MGATKNLRSYPIGAPGARANLLAGAGKNPWVRPLTDVTTGPFRVYYELGQAAGQRGEPRDVCPCRRADRRCAWMWGWYAGDDQRLQLDAWRAERRLTPVPAGRVGA